MPSFTVNNSSKTFLFFLFFNLLQSFSCNLFIGFTSFGIKTVYFQRIIYSQMVFGFC